MNKFKSILIVLILLIISVGVVSAADVNDTSKDITAASDVDILSDSDASYTDLNNNITKVKSNEKIVLNNNYSYQTSDKVNITKVENKKNITIDGQNNIINGNNHALAFEFSNSEVTLQNLVFKNCFSPIKMFNSSTITTINVTFENCSADGKNGGAVYAIGDSTYTSNNDKFIDNYASAYGAAIFIYDGTSLTVNNGTFSSKKHLTWGLIGAMQTISTITDSTFENTKSNYSTAINSDYTITIINSKFHNLSADLTAGAIAYKGSVKYSRVTIENNCEFINITSNKNGGALFLDIAGDSEVENEYTGTVIISDSRFINCSSEFGGALLQLGGTLTINNANFTNNHAEMIGGAIYTSYTNATINKANFEKNTAESNGGAIFFDMGRLTVTDSKFANNKGDLGGAITTYDASNTISNSQFENKTTDTIYTYFDKTQASITNCGEVNTTLNNRNTIIEVTERGNPIIINRQKIDGKSSDSSFDLRTLKLITSVKNQGSMGSCWAFGVSSAFESAFLIATGQTIDVSENNIQNLGLRYSIYGDTSNLEGGNFHTGANYFLDWFGAINSTDDVYDELGKISPAIFTKDAYHIMNAVYVPINENALKEALTTYGALSLYVLGAVSDSKYYDANHSSFYCNNPSDTANHYVTLVGWNDSYSKNNFAITAPGDGAWICKNSWGTGWGDEGYFYISYYDESMKNPNYRAIGFEINNDTENYDLLYQNTYQGITVFTDIGNNYLVNFKAQGNDIIAGVGTFFANPNTPYTISIYIDENLVYSQSGNSKLGGFETVRLNKYIAVQPNSTFTVQIYTPQIPIIPINYERFHSDSKSYTISNGKSYELDGSNAPIKVYAFTNNLTTKNIVSYDNIHNTIFTVKGPENANVSISFEGKNLTGTLINGTYDFKLGVLNVGGPYEVKISYNGQSFSNYVVIEPTINIGSVTSITVAYKSNLEFTMIFYDLNGTPLANTPVNIISAGKKLSAVTNNTGGYSFYVNTATKGSHNIVISNPVNNYTLNVPVNVVSRIVGNSNVKMYYYDGSKYKVRVKDIFGNFEGAGEIVTIKIGKKTFKVKTDKNGWAKLKIPSSIKPGKYTIKASYYGNIVKNKLTVKHVLKTKKTVKVKKSAKKLTLKAKLKAKKALKKKVVKFKVNGKTFKTKTNKKGIAKVTLKKSVIKKLKAGKKYKIKVSYLKDTVKSTLKVRR